MRKFSFVPVLVLILVGAVSACPKGRGVSDIERLIYISEAGSILPELQWYEEITVSRGEIVLRRNGKTADTEINAGRWSIVIETGRVERLFSRLAGFDRSVLRRLEPEISPDGGSRESFTLVYRNDRDCTVSLDPGVTYTGAEGFVETVREFLKTLTFPVGSERYIIGSEKREETENR